ncbi:hypothetical protein [Denitromonas sp.]|uniref:hypothetical protein n=1 Tax=Denitromonas sp. TaxID=2734609 RepID=UPI003A8C3EFD
MESNFLSRAQAADYIKDRYGLPAAKSTLGKLASIGGGPTYRLFCGRAVYTRSDLDTWVATKLSSPRSSTSSNEKG